MILRLTHKKTSVRPTTLQRETLGILRARLAEIGYDITAVTRRYRQHELDFIAIHKSMPTKILLVRPLRNGSVSVRPMLSPSLYSRARETLKSLRTPTTIRWSDRQLPFRHGLIQWYDFLPRHLRKHFLGGKKATIPKSEATLHG